MSIDTEAPTAIRTPDEQPPARRQLVDDRPAPTRPAPPPAPSAGEQIKWGVPLAVLIAGMFMSILDTSIVNVAISSIQADFGGSTADVEWISTAYTLVLGVVVPASAWLGDRFGMARIYNISLAAFALGSALCGLAWNLDSLIAFRIIQAIPGGILPAVTLTMVYRIVPPQQIGKAMGMYGLGVVCAPALGPALGGYLVEYLNWRLVFYINVPIGVLGLIAAIVALPKFSAAKSQRFDVLGFVTAAYAMVALLLAFSEGPDWGWSSYRVLILLVSGVLSFALFIVIELEVEHPLLNLRVFRFRPYTLSLVVMAIMMTGLFATLFYIPFFLQAGLGYQALDAGLMILPQALVMAFVTPFAGRLYDVVGPRWLVVVGLGIAALGSFLLSGISPDTTKHQIVLWTCVRSFGVGLSMMSVMTGGISSLSRDITNSGSAINTVVQRVSAALGLAGLTALATAQQASMFAGRSDLLTADNPQVSGMRFGEMYALYRRTQLEVLANSYSNIFLITGIVTALAIIPALFLRSGPTPKTAGAPAVHMD